MHSPYSSQHQSIACGQKIQESSPPHARRALVFTDPPTQNIYAYFSHFTSNQSPTKMFKHAS